MKKTPWFDGRVKPCADRVGVYESLYHAGEPYERVLNDWWDGRLWLLGDSEGVIASNQNRPWRGLTKEVK